MTAPTLRQLGQERLTWFLVSGMLVFALSSIKSPARNQAVGRQAELNRLRADFQKQWNRPPTAGESREIARESAQRDSLYRQAIASGLERDDAIIRRRLVQKMEFLFQDPALVPAPTEAQLSQYLEAHAAIYREPGRIAISHVFFSSSRRGGAALADARRALAGLRGQKHPPELSPDMGDPFMLAYDLPPESLDELAAQFGSGFAHAVFQQTGSDWQGPVESIFGAHLVRVRTRQAGRMPALAEARALVTEDWRNQRRREASDRAYALIRSRYQVVIQQDKP
jgi:hypothetical protein